ncbi:30S ribosomal protein S15 [Candidatus Woesearchaeota archaeon ex4484_78]|nr:MAG: 30S ribosomal protein S15 [Candidatus Woesearchaeota archaeon ex4484_78]
MARMHSRAKGKSGSKKPSKPSLSWVRYKPKEVELLVVKLAKQRIPPSQIGLILRDTYGIPSVKLICKKSILQILKEKNLAPELPEDLVALMRKYVSVKKHFDENKHDFTAKRGLQLTESKIRRLVKYYKRTGVLPGDWKLSVDTMRIYTE